MSSSSRKQERFLWAVDPFAPRMTEQFKTLRCLLSMAVPGKTPIEPVMVIPTHRQGLADEIFRALRIPRSLWEDALPLLLPPTFLPQARKSAQSGATILSRYAKETGALAIGLRTRNRKDLSRLLFGSFANSLVRESEVPLVLVGPHSRTKTKLKQAIFATDLSRENQDALRHLLPIVRRIGSELVVYHRLDLISPFQEGPKAGNPAYHAFYHQEVSNRENRLSRFMEIAKDQGIATKVQLENGKPSNREAILHLASRASTGLVILAPHRFRIRPGGREKAVQHLIRESHSPLLILPLAA